MAGFGFAEKVLALVVVAERETALLGQAQMFRDVAQATLDFAEQTLEIDGAAAIGELRQMVILEAQQGGENRHRRAGSGAVIAFANGRVEAGAGFFLDFFQRREQAPQPVGRAGVL